MSTYTIIPQAKMAGKKILAARTLSPKISENECRRECDNREECIAFSYAPAYLGVCSERLVNHPVGKCNLFYSTGQIQSSDMETLYLKGPRKSYMLLWIFLFVVVVVVFLSVANKK